MLGPSSKTSASFLDETGLLVVPQMVSTIQNLAAARASLADACHETIISDKTQGQCLWQMGGAFPTLEALFRYGSSRLSSGRPQHPDRAKAVFGAELPIMPVDDIPGIAPRSRLSQLAATRWSQARNRARNGAATSISTTSARPRAACSPSSPLASIGKRSSSRDRRRNLLQIGEPSYIAANVQNYSPQGTKAPLPARFLSEALGRARWATMPI
jgi:hypothetical protein